MENTFKVWLKNEIASYYHHIFLAVLFYVNPNFREIILHSGRGVTKSTFLCILGLCRLLLTPNADIMVLGYEFSSMRKKVFSDYKFAAFEILHLSEKEIEFHESSTGELYIMVRCVKDGKVYWNKIWFEHVKQGAEGLKGIRPLAKHRWIELRFYELTNFIDWNDEQIENTISTFIRNSYTRENWEKIKEFCTNNTLEYKEKDKEWLLNQPWYYKNWRDLTISKFIITYEFNTPSAGYANGAWVSDWLTTKIKEPGVYYQFNTYLDMTEYEQFKFLGPITLAKINAFKVANPIAYNHIYLGKKPYDGDLVFPNISYINHFGKFEDFKPDVLCIGVDIGRSAATVCNLNGYEFRDDKPLRVAIGIHNWYHCNSRAIFTKDDVAQPYHPKDTIQTIDMIFDFVNMVHREYPTKYIYFQMDYANEGRAFYDLMFKNMNKPMWLNVTKSWEKEPSDKRIDLMNSLLLYPGVCKFYTRGTFDAYKHQIWDKMNSKGVLKRLDDPSKSLLDMDRQDANEYSFPKQLYNVIFDRIKNYKIK